MGFSVLISAKISFGGGNCRAGSGLSEALISSWTVAEYPGTLLGVRDVAIWKVLKAHTAIVTFFHSGKVDRNPLFNS